MCVLLAIFTTVIDFHFIERQPNRPLQFTESWLPEGILSLGDSARFGRRFHSLRGSRSWSVLRGWRVHRQCNRRAGRTRHRCPGRWGLLRRRRRRRRSRGREYAALSSQSCLLFHQPLSLGLPLPQCLSSRRHRRWGAALRHRREKGARVGVGELLPRFVGALMEFKDK